MAIEVISNIVEANDNPFFAVVADTSVSGGITALADLAEIKGTFDGRRKSGQLFYAEDTGQYWQLIGGIADSNLVAVAVGNIRASRTVYVDVAGDDSAVGDLANPLATIDEASKRVALFGANKIILGVGNFEIPDYSALGDERFVLHGIQKLKIEGTKVPASQVSVNVTGWVGNVATVTEVLTPGALVGSLILTQTLGGGSFLRYRWVIANDASTVTVAVSTPTHGGFITPETGVRTLHNLGSKIVSNAANPSHFANNCWYSGWVEFLELHFDGAVNTGASFAARAANSLTEAIFNTCRVTDYNKGISGKGSMDWRTCWFEDCAQAVSAGSSNNWSADNVVLNATTTAILNNGGSGLFTLGALDVKWIFNCALFISGRGGYIQDFTPNVWVGGTLGTYCQLESTRSTYRKDNLGMRFIAGQDAVSSFVRSISGGIDVDFFGSAAAVMPTGNYINDNGVVISLADFNAGLGASTGVRLYEGPRGNFWFD